MSMVKKNSKKKKKKEQSGIFRIPNGGILSRGESALIVRAK